MLIYAPRLLLPEVSDSTITRLARTIDKSGFAVLPGYIGGDLLAELREMVIKRVDASGGEYFVLSGREQMADTALERIGLEPKFLELMHRLYEAGCSGKAPRQSLYQVLRCLVGETGKPQAYFFHYDSYLVTALLPIITPISGNAGDLVMRPNARPVRGSYLVNAVDKLLVDNKFSQKRFRRDAIAQRRGFTKVRIVPGNLYLFWGYRSVHANQPCDIDKIRATALFHFGDPHMNSKLRNYMGHATSRAKMELSPDRNAQLERDDDGRKQSPV